MGTTLGSSGSVVTPPFWARFTVRALRRLCQAHDVVMNHALFIITPLIGYICLWLLTGPLFVAYFKLLHIPLDLQHTVDMIRKVPPVLSILTVSLCSFVSFFVTTLVAIHALRTAMTPAEAVEVGAVALLATIVLDLLITVLGEKIDIRQFPVNLMYVFAWLVIIPAVVLART